MKIKLSELRKIIKEETSKILSHTHTAEKKNLAEGHARITEEEIAAWKKGDWGFVSETSNDPSAKELPVDYEVCGTCGYDHEYDVPLLSKEELLKVIAAHDEAGL